MLGILAQLILPNKTGNYLNYSGVHNKGICYASFLHKAFPGTLQNIFSNGMVSQGRPEKFEIFLSRVWGRERSAFSLNHGEAFSE